MNGLKKYRLTGSFYCPHDCVFLYVGSSGLSIQPATQLTTVYPQLSHFVTSLGTSQSGFSNSHTSIPSSLHTISSIPTLSVPRVSNRLTVHGPGREQISARYCWVHDFDCRRYRIRSATWVLMSMVITSDYVVSVVVYQKRA